MLLNEIQAKDLKIEKVQGDEPTKYFDYKTSREESTQKRFYMQGLHKKQGRFFHAVDHLINTQVVEEDRDCADNVVNDTSYGKIDMSGIDFGNKKNDGSRCHNTKFCGNNRSSKHDTGYSLLGCNNNTTKSSLSSLDDNTGVTTNGIINQVQEKQKL